jgi:neutral trehalase
LGLTQANPQTSLETVREHIEAEVNRLLLKQTENNQRWFEEKLTPELKQIEDDRKAFEILKKQHEEVLAAQSSIYAALTQLSQTVKDIPHVSTEQLGILNLPQIVPIKA